MVLVAISQSLVGKTLAESVYGSCGELLLARDTKLSPMFISRLCSLGISRIYIKDDRFDDIESAEVIRETTRRETQKTLTKLAKELRDGKNLSAVNREYEKLLVALDHVVDDLITNQTTMASFIDMKTHDDYTSAHCVNTCVLSVMLGMKYGLNMQRLRELGLGALLHDIGKALVPVEVLNKPSNLTADEYALIKNHCKMGFDMLKAAGETKAVTRNICFQHHERVDGSGYPRGLMGDRIFYMSKIVAVSDVFDALTSDRAYRKAYSNDIALRDHLNRKSGKFDSWVVELLHKTVCPYPPGSIVRLSNGQKGIVVSFKNDSADKPVVRCIEPDGRIIRDLNLALEPGVIVLETLANVES